MLFLVDYENVGKDGLRGCEYLDGQDHMIVFYSDNRKNAERRSLDHISTSGCRFEVCKLCKTGKNALDFYIASRLGELIGGGYEGRSVIISNDSGFGAVRDYWAKRSARRRMICLAANIEDGIVGGNEDNERTKYLRRQREMLSIGGYYSAYAEKMRIRAVLEKLFAGTEYEARMDEIQNLIEGKEKTSKIIYLSSLHLFGRKQGLEIYNKMKACDEL
ncbi:MAG: NYN domain-containing protein [Eubacterium sp.]|nr:NYN domain-containing protein [Eubacterium sp.]